MKTEYYLRAAVLGALTTIIMCSGYGQQTKAEPWKQSQLLPPAELAATITNAKAAKPVIISIGPGANIKGSVEIGPAQEKENLKKLKQHLQSMPKNTPLVIYCGCCPFEHCPNIRPAFQLLNHMKFTRHKLLNLPRNVKVDWIDKGYPVNK